MFKRVLFHELKSIIRDRMYAFFVGYSVMLMVIAYFLVPYLTNVNVLASHIVVITFILINAFMFGAITGFTLLDDQDDKVILSLRITTISMTYYLFIKLLISYLFGLIFTTLLVSILGLFKDANLTHIVMILILAPLQGPMIALIINCFATNKVEGFVYMKFSGILIMIPIASLFLTNWTELFLAVIPGFWTARLISIELLPFDYLLTPVIYFLLVVIVHLIFLTLFYKLYIKRITT
jgi:fluoroquinolone transport system permease protein